MDIIKKSKRILLIVFFSILPHGCFSEVKISDTMVYEPPIPKTEYDYKLGPGDVIEIIYHYTPRPESGQYHLSVGDVFSVEFTYHPDVNRELTVRPDGNVTMPRKGDLMVIGMTPTQIKDRITELYSDEFKDPVVNITMVQYDRAIEHLKRAITTAPRGESKLTAIRPDGYISFPMIDDIMAAGISVHQLKKITTQEYRKIIDNLTISLILQEMKNNLVYVMGEVRNPNFYLMEGPSSVMQMLARAGGALETANAETILVISRDSHRRPVGRLVNMETIVAEGNISHDIVLNQYDIVYVPKSRIASAGTFVELYINRIVPRFFATDYDLGGTLFQHRPVIRWQDNNN